MPKALQTEARRYLAVQAWALPPALFFRLYSTLNQSLGQPRMVTAPRSCIIAVKVKILF